MPVRATNNAWGLLSTAMSAQTTSLTLQSGQAARFPLLGPGEWFYVTVADTSGNSEIMKVTVTQGDQFTVVRAVDGSAALSWAATVRVQLNVNFAFWTDFNADMDAIVTGERTFNAAITLNGDPTTALMAATKQYMDAHFMPKTTAMMAPLGYVPVKQLTGNTILFGWDGTWIQLQVDSSYQGGAWTTANFNPGAYAGAGNQLQWNSGIIESGAVDIQGGGGGTQTIGNPWVMEGYRNQYDQSFPQMYVYGRYIWYRNQ